MSKLFKKNEDIDIDEVLRKLNEVATYEHLDVEKGKYIYAVDLEKSAKLMSAYMSSLVDIFEKFDDKKRESETWK